MVSENWLAAFDEHLLKLFGINHVDAGLDDERMLAYTDLEPREAAIVFGEDYGLDPVD